MDTQVRLGSALFDSLIRLRQQKGTLSMEDVGALFMQISKTLQPPVSETDHALKEDIEQLAIFIEQAKNEISTITTSHESEDSTGSATLHLDAVLKATEEAGHAIMDAADTISAAVNGIGGERQQAIEGAITKIYEACNFQDLTGQRVGKVIKTLNEIDSRIAQYMLSRLMRGLHKMAVKRLRRSI